MKKSILVKILFICGILVVFVFSCGNPPPATEQSASVASPTEKSEALLPTDLPQSSPTPVPTTEVPPSTPTEAPSPTPQPTQTFTPQPTDILPTDTLTPIPIPVLERTLSLQTPFLEGDDVLMLQEQLLLLGYTEVGTPDGVFGGMTDTAVKHFQEDQGLAVDGTVGQQTWETLFNVVADELPPPDTGTSFSYYLGYSGDEVGELETRLQELGYPICDTDQYFDAQTEFAVQQFQAAHDLEADGVVGPKTWDLLFSENALPAAPPELQLSFSSPVEIGNADDLAYDGKNIWVARSSYGFEDDAISKLDSFSGTGINRITVQTLGESKGPNGETYTSGISIASVTPAKGAIWVGGRTSGGKATGTPVIAAIAPSGKLLGDPIYVGTSNVDASEFVGFFTQGNTVWAVVNEPHTVLYELSASPVKYVRRLTPYDMYAATGAAFDGAILWVAATKGQTPAVWAINLESSAVGRVLGVCAEKLAYDGQWVWATQMNTVLAVDPSTGQVMAAASFEGYPDAITSNGKNQIWLLTSYNSDSYLQNLKTR